MNLRSKAAFPQEVIRGKGCGNTTGPVLVPSVF